VREEHKWTQTQPSSAAQLSIMTLHFVFIAVYDLYCSQPPGGDANALASLFRRYEAHLLLQLLVTAMFSHSLEIFQNIQPWKYRTRQTLSIRKWWTIKRAEGKLFRRWSELKIPFSFGIMRSNESLDNKTSNKH